MITLKGIVLSSDDNDIDELHRFAAKIVLSKSWFNLHPYPHYTVICPFRQQRAIDIFERRERKLKKYLENWLKISIFVLQWTNDLHIHNGLPAPVIQHQEEKGFVYA